MADAERERLDLNERIERLTMDKHGLEADNASKIEENRQLLDQLEILNNTIADSDVKIKTLESTLLTSQATIRRLEAAAARASDTERHLLLLEEEQEKLHKELMSTREDARSHAQRCKEAQRGIMDMQDQLERIEDEARTERMRHEETVQRMERQREIEKQLDTAAKRLKGAAATKSTTQGQNGNSHGKEGGQVVGHFVRDLLQDNANLQLGIAELREMLTNSNDEIQILRDQLTEHQPSQDISPASTLRAELEPMLDRPTISQQLHVHHHYHVSPRAERKPKKKRQGLLPGIFTPPTQSVPSSPRHSWGSLPPHFRSDPASDDSSAPSSPQLEGRVFDSVSPESDAIASPASSFDAMSPSWGAHSKRPSTSSTRSFQSLTASLLDSIPDAPRYANTITEEDETPDLADGTTATEDSLQSDPEWARDPPRLRRMSSQESIVSLTGGLDIHTLKMRPSQLSLRPLGGADVVVTGVVAQPTLSRTQAKRSSAALRDTFAGFQSPRSVSSPAGPETPGKLGRWAGWRPWGGSSPAADDAPKDSHRTPGINQAGAIPGLWAQKLKGAPAQVTAASIDRDALTEILSE